jgi:hypothetical protein
MADLNATSITNTDMLIAWRFCRDILRVDYIRHPLHPPRLKKAFDQALNSEEFILRADFARQIEKRNDFMLKADLAQMENYFGIGRERLTFFRRMALVFFKDQGLVVRPGANLNALVGRRGLFNMKRRLPIATGTERHSFSQVLMLHHSLQI